MRDAMQAPGKQFIRECVTQLTLHGKQFVRRCVTQRRLLGNSLSEGVLAGDVILHYGLFQAALRP